MDRLPGRRPDAGPRRRPNLVFPVLTLIILGFNLVWYGWYLSFPLFGEDGAANYSFLVEALRYSSPFTTRFLIKWLEGLGQVNMFVTVTFDPFSWVMLLGPDKGDLFRIAYAVRATVCWVGTYLLVSTVLRRMRCMAAMAASLCMLLSFTFVTFKGIPTFAGIFVASQLALFPALLWLYWRLARDASVIGWTGTAFVILLAVFLLVHPLGSILGVCVLTAYGIAIALTARKRSRRRAWLALGKLGLAIAAILFTPVIGAYRAWSAVARVSARQVFASELTSYSREYILPYLWSNVPFAIRLVVIIAAGVLLVRRPWPQAVRVAGVTTALVIGASQLLTMARTAGIAGEILDRVPRAFYLEFYLPVFYALGAAYVSHRWQRVWWPPFRKGPIAGVRVDLFIVGVGWLTAYVLRFYVVGPALVTNEVPGITDYMLALPVVVWVWWLALRLAAADGKAEQQSMPRRLLRSMTASGVASGAVAMVSFTMFAGFHYSRVVVAYFVAMSTIGVGVAPACFPNATMRVPISMIIRLIAFGLAAWAIVGAVPALVIMGLILLGEAWRTEEIMRRSRPFAFIVPASVLVFVVGGVVATWLFWPREIHPLFAAELRCQQRDVWCRDRPGRTMGAAANPITEFLSSRLSMGGGFRGRADFLLIPGLRLNDFPLEPSDDISREEFEIMHRWYARAFEEEAAVYEASLYRWQPAYFDYARRRELVWAMRGLVTSAEPTAGVLPDDVIVEIAVWAAKHPDRAKAVQFVPAWDAADEVSIMIQERNRNFLATGNGMLLRALPVQGVPVASSYEQALDYLYYLLWTRYVNEGVPARRSINFTSLETVRPERLGLIGVRYVVARNVPYRMRPELSRVFEWHGYSVYEVPDANVDGWAPGSVRFGQTLVDELRALRDPSFDPRSVAVVAAAERGWLDERQQFGGFLASQVSIDGQSLVFSATGKGGWTLAVLPFKYSHCWHPTWEGSRGRLIRVDVALLGVLFQGDTRVRLAWSAGYGIRPQCLEKDGALVADAAAAGAEIR